MKLMICAYQRTGSTALFRSLRLIAGDQSPVHLANEPFTHYDRAESARFPEDVDAVLALPLVKHHPADLLGPDQNRDLYQRWLEADGKLLHLYRQDSAAQARSLCSARRGGSWHAAYSPPRLHSAEFSMALREVTGQLEQQGKLLSEFPHRAITYEELLGSDLNLARRVTALHELVVWAAPELASRIGSTSVGAELERLLGPSGRYSTG